MTTRCIHCGNIVEGISQFCEHCQPEVQPEWFRTQAPTTYQQTTTPTTPCPSCGAPVREGVNYCASCGRPVAGVEYAGFWIRFAAAIIDGVLLSVANVVVGLVVSDLVTSILLQMAVSALYSIGFWVGADGQTPGKMAVGVRVTMENGEPLDLGPAILRYIGYFPSGLLFGIGYLMIAFNRQKLGLHDYIGGTVVVRK